MKIKDGKLPLSSKSQIGPRFDNVDFMSNVLKLPEAFVAQLNKLGFEHRFISSIKLSDMQGHHNRGWKVFHIGDFNKEGRDIIELDSYLQGLSPSGSINRAEMVLAIRPTEMCNRHRAHIQRRTDVQSGDHVKRAAEQMRESAKQSGTRVPITEGYED